jgi:hypothetical protein
VFVSCDFAMAMGFFLYSSYVIHCVLYLCALDNVTIVVKGDQNNIVTRAVSQLRPRQCRSRP